MTHVCVMAGLLLVGPCVATPSHVRPALIATDRPRCRGDAGRIKAPRPIVRKVRS